jgi:hypothetical protein
MDDGTFIGADETIEEHRIRNAKAVMSSQPGNRNSLAELHQTSSHWWPIHVLFRERREARTTSMLVSLTVAAPSGIETRNLQILEQRHPDLFFFAFGAAAGTPILALHGAQKKT